EAGKHVMCEKPMAINSAEALKMLEAARRTGKKLTIGYQNRQVPDHQYLKTEAEQGTFGNIYYARAMALRRRGVPTWGVFLSEEEQGGGPLIDIATHSLDLTLWILDNYEPAYCVGKAFHALNDQTNVANAWGDWDPEKFTVEDSAFGFVVMKNGAVISVESSWALNTVRTDGSLLFCGTKAGADTLGDRITINGVRNGRRYVFSPDMSAGGVEFYDGIDEGDSSLVEAKQWILSIINDTEPCVRPEQAYVVTRILEGIYESSKTGDIYRFD
ncbi:MAG: Gfo/Idh/MocA family oxidoreductase, partial [Clostridia bacterium]|nr:Gfo/Idh/MocA family oxidoreductase [Clostridia bacterium]